VWKKWNNLELNSFSSKLEKIVIANGDQAKQATATIHWGVGGLDNGIQISKSSSFNP